MYLDRGLQAALSIVVAFSMLWTIAILIPDKNAANPMGLADGERSSYVIHSQHPRILKSTSNMRAASKSDQATRQNRILDQPKQLPSATQTQPLTLELQSTYTEPTYTKPTSSESQSQNETKTNKLFPAYFWYMTALFLYKTRNFFKKRTRKEYDYYDESFFQMSGLDNSLNYGHGLEYEDPDDDFLSVNSNYGSNYGSSSRWSPDKVHKFDLDDLELEMTDSQI